MIQTLRTRGLRMFLGAAAILVAGAGVAWAAIPGSTGVINGCYGNQSGVLRVIDSGADARCLNSETPISWSQQGQQGEQGPQGIQGLQGERGLQGVAGPDGPRGPAGVSGWEPRSLSHSVPAHSAARLDVECAAGKRPLGGGYVGVDTGVTVHTSTFSVIDDAWAWSLFVTNTNAIAESIRVEVICADV